MEFRSSIESGLAEVEFALRLDEAPDTNIHFATHETAELCRSASNELTELLGAVNEFCDRSGPGLTHKDAYVDGHAPQSDYLLWVECRVLTTADCIREELTALLRTRQELIYAHFDSLIRGHISRRGRRSAPGVGRLPLGPVCD